MIEGFAILFYFVMVPEAYEANYINKLFLISFQLFDYAASRLQNFRSNKSSPESHGWWKIFVSRRKACAQFWSLGGRKPCFKMVSICVCGPYSSHVLVTDWDRTGAAFHARGCPSVSVLPVNSHACPWDGGERESRTVSPVVARVQERKKQLSLSLWFCLVLGISDTQSPLHPSLYSLYDRIWLLFLWITFHTKEVLSLLFSESLTFPVAWAGSVQALHDLESQRQFWLSKVVCPPVLYPAFATGE